MKLLWVCLSEVKQLLNSDQPCVGQIYLRRRVALVLVSTMVRRIIQPETQEQSMQPVNQ